MQVSACTRKPLNTTCFILTIYSIKLKVENKKIKELKIMFSDDNVYYDAFRPNSVALRGYDLNKVMKKLVSSLKSLFLKQCY